MCCLKSTLVPFSQNYKRFVPSHEMSNVTAMQSSKYFRELRTPLRMAGADGRDWITLNVGGQKFLTSRFDVFLLPYFATFGQKFLRPQGCFCLRSTICQKEPSCMLARMFAHQEEGVAPRWRNYENQMIFGEWHPQKSPNPNG